MTETGSPKQKGQSAFDLTLAVPLIILLLLGLFDASSAYLAFFLGGLWLTVTRLSTRRIVNEFILLGAAVLVFPALAYGVLLMLAFGGFHPVVVTLALLIVASTAYFFWRLMLKIRGEKLGV